MFYTRAHVHALEAQISRLEAQLAEANDERKQLLDRILAKNNIESIQPQPQPVKTPENVQLISPFGNVNSPEMADAFKESWINEEAQYLMAEEGITDAQAREMAERRFISEHRAI